MFKFTPRHILWDVSVWAIYLVVGVGLYCTSNLDEKTVIIVQLIACALLAAPLFCRPLRAWLYSPRAATLRVQGQSFEA
jgi:hypothetical protein